MRALYVFMRGVTRINEWTGRAVSWLILPIFVLLMLEVFTRYFLGRPTVWTNELAQLLFGVYAVLAGGYLLAHGGHVNVDLLYGKLSVRARALVDVLTSVLFFVFVGALLYYGSSLAYESIETWERSQSAWNPYIWPFKLVVPLAAFLLLLQGIVKLVRDLMILLGVEPPAGPAAGARGEEA
ncbi:MAG TPA: TRAP transporter small permease subunit [Burkholderiales bacterium]